MEKRKDELDALLLGQSRFLREALDSIEDGIVVVNEKGEFIAFNSAAIRILRMGPDALSFEEWTEKFGLFLPNRTTPYPTDDQPLAKAIRGETSENVEMFLRRPDVEDGVWLSVSARPFVADGGTLKGGVAILRDITRRKVAEDAWELLETATHQASDCIIITTANGNEEEPRIVFVNSATVDFVGHSKDELIGESLSLMHGSRTDPLVSQLWWKFAAEKPFRDRIYIYDKEGKEYFADVRISPLVDEHGILTNFVCVLRDITAQKQTEEAIRELNHGLEHRIQDLENTAVDIHTKLHMAATELLRVSQHVEEQLARGVMNS